MFYSLASALAYLEGKDIVHSNITHDSVLFDFHENLKLAGFAFSLYKPWKIYQKRMYQSYRPPEKLSIQTKSNSKEEEKRNAFKSDVWCLGKLIIDICLLQDELCWQKTGKETYAKIKVDLKEVERIYQDKNLIKILKAVLDPKPEKRPSFKDIRDDLQETYQDLRLIEMENRKEEEPNLEQHFSRIQSEFGDSQSETNNSQSEQDNILKGSCM